jgi:hypothetical protein
MAEKLTKAQRDVLQRIADGWSPLWSQLDGAHRRRLEGAGFIKADFDDANRIFVRIAPAGRALLSAGGEG